MNLQRPLSLISHPLDGDVLAVLSRGDKAFTGREVQRAAGASHDGVRVALQRLVSEGIVESEQAGRAIMYRLNRDHLAAPFIEGLASLRLRLIERLREQVTGWEVQPVVAALFGSAAKGEATRESDIDIFVVRPAEVGDDSLIWRDQVGALEASANRWTGNEVRTLEYSESELPAIRQHEPVVWDIAKEGIVLAGSLSKLRRAPLPARRS